MALPDTPHTGEEQYLAKIAGEDVALPEMPQTRVERYLAYIAENGSGSGGGGADNAVKYTAQSLTDVQKAQARTNIGADAVPVRETVSGTSATIDAEVDTIYVCGEMSAVTIDTFPSVGIFSVIFDSGATATTLTVPQTLIMPDSFTVEANKRYEINVMDGYATAQGWAVSA